MKNGENNSEKGARAKTARLWILGLTALNLAILVAFGVMWASIIEQQFPADGGQQSTEVDKAALEAMKMGGATPVVLQLTEDVSELGVPWGVGGEGVPPPAGDGAGDGVGDSAGNSAGGGTVDSGGAGDSSREGDGAGGGTSGGAPGTFSDQINGIIVPHHLLVSSFMEKFYTEVGARNQYDRVVILSPNHFGLGHNFIRTTDSLEGVPHRGESGVPRAEVSEGESGGMLTLDTAWISELVTRNDAYIEGDDFDMEHGVYVQYPFIAKYFPGAAIVPIIIKKDTPCGVLDKLADDLSEMAAAGEAGHAADGAGRAVSGEASGEQDIGAGNSHRTLIIASLDFTHYSEESIALKNDRQTVEWLKNVVSGKEPATLDPWSTMWQEDTSENAVLCQSAKELARGNDRENAEAVAIDSGETLYVLTKIMRNEGSANFNFWERTSSASLVQSTPAGENTSHIFGYFTAN